MFVVSTAAVAVVAIIVEVVSGIVFVVVDSRILATVLDAIFTVHYLWKVIIYINFWFKKVVIDPINLGVSTT